MARARVVALAEVRADPSPSGSRGVWGYSFGSSSLMQFGACYEDSQAVGPDIGPNCPGDAAGGSGDHAGGCQTGLSAAQVFALNMGCVSDSYAAIQGPKSSHPGGLLTVFCDGSVHWLDDNIQVGVISTNIANCQNGYWEMLFLSQDGANVPGDVYGAN